MGVRLEQFVMIDTPKTDKEAMWAVSGTGEDFQCIYIDESRDMERLLIEARDLLVIYSNNDVLGCGGDELVKKINGYFEP